MSVVKTSVKDLKESIKDSFKSEVNPVPLEVFPEVVQNIIKEKAKQSLPLEFLFSSVLASVSIATGNSLKGELIPGMPTNASIWLSVVADSGEGKTEGIESFLKPLLKIESENYKKFKEEEAEAEAINKKNKALPYDQQDKEVKKPTRKQRIIQDVTVEAFADRMQKNPNGLGAYIDEIKGFVTSQGQYKGGKGNDRQFWLSAWNGKTAMKDRVDQSIYIENVCFSIIGGIQKEEANDLFGTMVSDGFAPRFLIVLADNVPEGKWSLEPIDRSTEVEWEKIIRSITDLENADFENRLVKFDREAGEVLVNWRNTQTKANNFTTRLFDAKLRIYAIRLSLILHVLKRACEGQFYENDTIDKATAENALILVNYFRNNALKLIKSMKLDDPLEALDATKLKLYDMLPKEFTTGEGEQISKENKLLSHTAFSTFLKNKRLFKKINKGIYEKIISDGDND